MVIRLVFVLVFCYVVLMLALAFWLLLIVFGYFCCGRLLVLGWWAFGFAVGGYCGVGVGCCFGWCWFVWLVVLCIVVFELRLYLIAAVRVGFCIGFGFVCLVCCCLGLWVVVMRVVSFLTVVSIWYCVVDWLQVLLIVLYFSFFYLKLDVCWLDCLVWCLSKFWLPFVWLVWVFL